MMNKTLKHLDPVHCHFLYFYIIGPLVMTTAPIRFKPVLKKTKQSRLVVNNQQNNLDSLRTKSRTLNTTQNLLSLSFFPSLHPSNHFSPPPFFQHSSFYKLSFSRSRSFSLLSSSFSSPLFQVSPNPIIFLLSTHSLAF